MVSRGWTQEAVLNSWRCFWFTLWPSGNDLIVGSCEVLSICWGAFHSSEAKGGSGAEQEFSTSEGQGVLTEKIRSPCLCSLHKNWVQESRVLASLSSAKQREWFAGDLWGSQLKRAAIELKDGLALLKERGTEPLRYTGSHRETNYRLTHQLIVCALVQWAGITPNLCDWLRGTETNGGSLFPLKPIPQPLTKSSERQLGSGGGGPASSDAVPVRQVPEGNHLFSLDVSTGT